MLTHTDNLQLALDVVGVFVFALCGGLGTFRFRPSVGRITPVVRILDAAGLAAVGGGARRDLLAGQVPEVLRRAVYAVPALLGAALIVVAHHLDLVNTLTIWGFAAVVLTVRIIAVLLDLNAPMPLRTRTRPL